MDLSGFETHAWLIGFAVAQLLLFVKLLRAIGRWEQRAELLWAWYLEHHPDIFGFRRRHSDQQELAHDHGDDDMDH